MSNSPLCPCDDEHPTTSTTPPDLDIVIIGRNEGERLARCIESVRLADYPQEMIRIIYVDSESSDGSAERAASMGAEVIRLTGGKINAAVARNAGLRRVKREYIHFLDGDTTVHRSWFRHAVAQMNCYNAACVFGQCSEQRPYPSVYARLAAIKPHTGRGNIRYCGGNALFRRSALRAATGFCEELIAGEDAELCARLHAHGAKVLFLDQPMVEHDTGILTFPQYWRRAVRTGWAYAFVGWSTFGKSRLWVRRTLAVPLEVSVWLVLLTYACVWRSGSACLAFAGLVLVRSLWTALHVHASAESLSMAFLYGLHCQFLRIPLLVGGIRGVVHLVTGRRAAVMEYRL